MNDLSWMLYWADVAGGVGGFLGVVGGFVLICSTVAFLPLSVHREDMCEETYDNGIGLAIRGVVIGLIAVTIALFVPAKSTIYAIAASEMGEEALNTETGGKAVKALNAWLDRQIEGEDE